jgi:hypothetical protein
MLPDVNLIGKRVLVFISQVVFFPARQFRDYSRRLRRECVDRVFH